MTARTNPPPAGCSVDIAEREGRFHKCRQPGALWRCVYAQTVLDMPILGAGLSVDVCGYHRAYLQRRGEIVPGKSWRYGE